MLKDLVVVNLYNSYNLKNFYRDFHHEIIDLSDIQGLNYICQLDRLDLVQARLSQAGKESIKYFGSGNYHYLSYLTMSNLREDFSLALFDNHVECLKMPYPNLISCGSWLNNLILDNPHLREIFILGPKRDYLDQIPREYLKDGFMKIISQEDLDKEDILSLIKPSYQVYISLDKDVFSPSLVKTNWDQGLMTWEQYKAIYHSLEVKNIIGMDICGEESYPGGNIFKRSRLEEIKQDNQLNYKLINYSLA